MRVLLAKACYQKGVCTLWTYEKSMSPFGAETVVEFRGPHDIWCNVSTLGIPVACHQPFV